MPTCPDRQALSGVLVYDSQQPHSPAVLGPDQNEVVGPYVVRPLGSEPDARPVIEPKSCSPGLFAGHFQPFPSPDPLHSLVVHPPTTMSEESGDPAVAVPAEPACQLYDVGSEDLLVLSWQGFIPLSGPGLIERSAGSTLRDTDDHSDMLCALATTGRAQKFPSAASLRIWLSSVRSATALFRRVFSDSSCLKRFTWSILRPPYSLRHR